ncbi:MAG: hypothetical protein ACRDH5_00520 [bacterium]
MTQLSGAVLNDGKANIVDLLDPATRNTSGNPRHIGWGSSGTAATITQAGLLSGHPEARSLCVVSQPATNNLLVSGVIEATAARTVREVVLFSAASGGVGIARATHTQRDLLAADRVEYIIACIQEDDSES